MAVRAMRAGGLFAALVLQLAAAREVIQLGGCFGYFNQMGVYMIMAKVAHDEGYFDDILPAGGRSADFAISVRPVDTQCSGSESTLVTLPLLLGQGALEGRIFAENATSEPVVAIAGCTCSGATIPVSSMATNYKVPMVSGSATSPTLSNKGLHPYFSRVVPPDSMQGLGFARLIVHFNWKRVLFVYAAEDYASGIAAAVKTKLAAGTGVTVIEYQLTFQPLGAASDAASFDPQLWVEVAHQVAGESPQPRIFFTVGIVTEHITRIFYDIGLVGPSTVWMQAEGTCGVSLMQSIGSVQADYVSNANAGNRAWFEDFDWMSVPRLMKGMLCLTPKSLGPKYGEARFQHLFGNMTKEKLDANGWYSTVTSPWLPYWDDQWLTTEFFEGLVYNPLAFDSMAAIIVAIGEMLAAGTAAADIKGEPLLTKIRGLAFESVTGPVAFDARGDRLAPYDVWNMRIRNNGGTEEPYLARVGEYNAGSDTVTFTEDPIFADGTTTVPDFRPAPCQPGYEFGGISAGCVPCRPGAVSIAADSTCIICQPGYFQDEVGGTACKPAPAGTYVASNASTVAANCPAGQYTSEKGLTACSSCLAGFYQGQEGATGCDRCERGWHSGEGAGSCDSCAPGMTTESTASSSQEACQCPEGQYCEGAWPACICKACPEGMTCPFGAKAANLAAEPYTGTYPLVKAGYYTKKSEPLSVYFCHPSKGDKCPGSTPEACVNNLEGLTCGSCPEGWAVSGEACKQCSGGNIFVLLIVLPVCGLLCCTIVYYFGNRPVEVNSTVMLGVSVVFGLIVTVMQLFATFDQLTLPWPGGVKGFFKGSTFFVVNPGALSAECLGRDPVVQYLFRFLLPWAVLAAMLICFAVAKLLGAVGVLRSSRQWQLAKVINSVFQIYQAIFIALTAISAVSFQCYSHPNGERSLVQYPVVICGESSHQSMVALSVILIVTFVLPFIGVQIWANIYAIRIRAEPGKMGLHLTRFRFLMYRFRPDVWWWGTVFTIRQTLLAFAPMLEPDDPHTQSVFIIAVLVIYTCVCCFFWPWKSDELNLLDTVSMGLIVILVASVSSFMPASTAHGAHTSLMVAILILVAIFAAFVAVYGAVMLCFGGKVNLIGMFGFDEQRLKSRAQLSRLTEDLYALCANLQAAPANELVESLLLMNSYDLRKVKSCVDVFKASTVVSVAGNSERQPVRLVKVPHSNNSSDDQQAITRAVSGELARGLKPKSAPSRLDEDAKATVLKI